MGTDLDEDARGLNQWSDVGENHITVEDAIGLDQWSDIGETEVPLEDALGLDQWSDVGDSDVPAEAHRDCLMQPGVRPATGKGSLRHCRRPGVTSLRRQLFNARAFGGPPADFMGADDDPPRSLSCSSTSSHSRLPSSHSEDGQEFIAQWLRGHDFAVVCSQILEAKESKLQSPLAHKESTTDSMGIDQLSDGISWAVGGERSLSEAVSTVVGTKRIRTVATPALPEEAPSVYAFLRGSFDELDTEHRRLVCEEDLLRFMCKGSSRAVPADDEEAAQQDVLLQAAAKRAYKHAVLRSSGLNIHDWVHFGLMLAFSPSQLSRDLLNRRLREELAANPMLLGELLEAFEVADARGGGLLRICDIEAAFDNGDLRASNLGLENDDEASYYDFVAFRLGYRRSSVVLNWYDVSNGLAQWVPTSMLGGRRLQGVWHLGVVAFGKEFWYGGRVLASEPGTAPFPPGPLRSTTVGYTTRATEELHDFLRFELAPRYTADSYDVLKQNCNHFADEVVGFLVPGVHVPDEARLQSETFLSGSLLDRVRQSLNAWLGGFGAAGSGIDDLMPEWRIRLRPGDLAMYVPKVLDEPSHVVQVSQVDVQQGICDITYFEPHLIHHGTSYRTRFGSCNSRDESTLRQRVCARSRGFWNWHLARRSAVPVCNLRPHSVHGRGISATAGSGLASWRRGAWKEIYPEFQEHLLRKVSIGARCQRGHTMQPAAGMTRSWVLSKQPPCGICARAASPDVQLVECTSCGFYICGSCNREGALAGYYSLGSTDLFTSKKMLQEPAWVRYKALRYLAAARIMPGGAIGLELWLHRMAVRVYGDLGLSLPSKADLAEVHRRFCHCTVAENGQSLVMLQDEFVELFSHLVALAAAIVSL